MRGLGQFELISLTLSVMLSLFRSETCKDSVNVVLLIHCEVLERRDINLRRIHNEDRESDTEEMQNKSYLVYA